ncbi:hypothetical protein, partial [Pseudonocardia pini]|uniref:hypothetical protein n=1 Tax=Pseudonocardia pini TaxID=2758030 RepID=UPI001C693648
MGAEHLAHAAATEELLEPVRTESLAIVPRHTWAFGTPDDLVTSVINPDDLPGAARGGRVEDRLRSRFGDIDGIPGLRGDDDTAGPQAPARRALDSGETDRAVRWRVPVRWYLFVLLALPAAELLGAVVVPGAMAAYSPLTLAMVATYPPRSWSGVWTPPTVADIAMFVVMITGLTIVMTWVFTNARGSLLLTMLMHASFTTFADMVVAPLFPAPPPRGVRAPPGADRVLAGRADRGRRDPGQAELRPLPAGRAVRGGPGGRVPTGVTRRGAQAV